MLLKRILHLIFKVHKYLVWLENERIKAMIYSGHGKV